MLFSKVGLNMLFSYMPLPSGCSSFCSSPPKMNNFVHDVARTSNGDGVAKLTKKSVSLGCKLGNNYCKGGKYFWQVMLDRLPDCEAGRVAACINELSTMRGYILFAMAMLNYRAGKTDLRLRNVWWVMTHPMQAWKTADLDQIMGKVDFLLVRSLLMSGLDYLTLAGEPLKWIIHGTGECVLPALSPMVDLLGSQVELAEMAARTGHCRVLGALNSTAGVLDGAMTYVRNSSKILSLLVVLQIGWGLRKFGCTKKFAALHVVDLFFCSLEVAKVALSYKKDWAASVAMAVSSTVYDCSQDLVIPYLGLAAVTIGTALIFAHLVCQKPEDYYRQKMKKEQGEIPDIPPEATAKTLRLETDVKDKSL